MVLNSVNAKKRDSVDLSSASASTGSVKVNLNRVKNNTTSQNTQDNNKQSDKKTSSSSTDIQVKSSATDKDDTRDQDDTGIISKSSDPASKIDNHQSVGEGSENGVESEESENMKVVSPVLGQVRNSVSQSKSIHNKPVKDDWLSQPYPQQDNSTNPTNPTNPTKPEVESDSKPENLPNDNSNNPINPPINHVASIPVSQAQAYDDNLKNISNIPNNPSEDPNPRPVPQRFAHPNNPNNPNNPPLHPLAQLGLHSNLNNPNNPNGLNGELPTQGGDSRFLESYVASLKKQMQLSHETECKHLNLRFQDHIKLTKGHFQEKISNLSEQLRVTKHSLNKRRQAEEQQVTQLKDQLRATEERLKAEEARATELQFQTNTMTAQPQYVQYQRLLNRLEQVEHDQQIRERKHEESLLRAQNAVQKEKYKHAQDLERLRRKKNSQIAKFQSQVDELLSVLARLQQQPGGLAGLQ